MKHICNFSLCILCLLYTLLSCVRQTEISGGISADETETAETEDLPPLPDPFRVHAAEIASSMDDRLLAAQVLITGIDGRGSLPAHIKEPLEEIPAGGVMLFRYNLDTDNDSIRSLIAQTVSVITEETGIRPFIAVDMEGGTVNRLRGNREMPAAGTLPAASSYGQLFQEKGKEEALRKIEEDSYNAGREIFNLGINMNFAPVAEYINDENREFLTERSYGHDPFFTAEAAVSFIQGMEKAGVLCAVKHFPGSAGNDPHYSLSVIEGDKTYLDSLIFPFKFAIEKRAGAVMAAHTLVPAIDSSIASLSSAVLNGWLREELGFDGIIIADDFIMAAAGQNSPEKAAVLSIAAGADMVLVWPSALKRTHQALLTALENGSLPRERLQDAATRIIYEKMKMGLINE